MPILVQPNQLLSIKQSQTHTSFYMCNMLGCIFVLAIHVLKHGFWVVMFSDELRVMRHPTLPMCGKGDMLI
jgi:hypothetical protein